MTVVTHIPAARGPLWIWVLIAAALVGGAASLSLLVFNDHIVPLAYGLPLLICAVKQDRRLLWGMALAFVVVLLCKHLFVLPADARERYHDMFLLMQTANVLLPAWVIDAGILLSRRLDRMITSLERSNAELEATNEELASREEEISQQNEEMQSQAGELEQQMEELSAQSEELQTLNEQLAARERTLNDLIETSTGIASEQETLARLGDAVGRLLGPRAAGAAILEPAGDSFVVHPLFGMEPGPARIKRDRTLAAAVMTRDRPGYLADASLRPDLDFPPLAGASPVRSVLAAPLHLGEAHGGALEIYSDTPGEWAEQDLRLGQWVAEQSGRLWATGRLREDLNSHRDLLRSVTDNSTVALFMLDERGMCTYANPAAERMTGYTAAELGARPLHELVHHQRPDGTSFPPDECVLDRALPATTHLKAHEDVFIRKDGQAFPVLCGVSPVVRDGRTVCLVLEVQDVTVQKHTAQEREELIDCERAARATAERASRAKDEFVATLSHELRTPLNAIMGWATLLRKGARDEETTKGLEVIERNARHQAQLISDLLDISRITAGKIRLEVQAVDVTLVIEGALDAVRPAAEAKGVTIRKVLEPIDRVVSGDPNRLQQVVWNLLTNAVKFTPRGGSVQVVLARTASYVQITVSDTGQGIDPELLPQLFERYRQGDSSATRRTGGLGLGLAIVKHLVELHGGTVHIRSEGEGKGTACSVLLPVRAVEPHEQTDGPHPQFAPSLALSSDAPSLSGLSVLLVDDEQDALDLVRRILTDRGAEVQTANSAQDALDALERTRPNVLISDIGMPGMDGYTLMRTLRERWPERTRTMPSIALTAFARSEDRTRALLAGFQSHIAKPVEPAELVATVASVRMMLRSEPASK